MNLDMTMFQQTFFEEASDILTDLEDLLLRLEATPDEPDLLNTIFRCAHSLKGGSATFGLTDIAHFTHSLETLLDRLRNGQAKVDHTVVQLLLQSLDQLQALLAVARGDASSAPDSEALIFQIEEMIVSSGYVEEAWDEDALRAEIAQMLAAQDSESEAGTAAPPALCEGQHRYRLRIVPDADVMRCGADPATLPRLLAEAGEIISIRCDTERLPSLHDLDPERCYLAWDAEFISDWDRERLLNQFEFLSVGGEIELDEVTELIQAVTPDQNAPDSFWNREEAMPASQPDTPAAPPMPSAPFEELMATSSQDVSPPLQLQVTTTSENKAPASPSKPASSGGGNANKAEAQVLRVSTDKVDKLINLVGELVINQSMLNEVIQDFSMAKLPRLREAVAEMEQASRELQERVMAVRMLPIKHAFGRFPRLVHDLATKCDKKIELKTTGEETELDKTVIEAIADPLTHLIRNSIDHGMETPEERVAKGKPATGTVMLNAFHEGGNIVIEVGDDGRGLNRERILQKAQERGLISEGESLADEAIYNLIFAPGFSTAAAVTDLSGRGVGMDIVKSAVQNLGGSISLSTTPGAGTRFRIRLPLTMAILEGLSVAVGGEVYILPLTSIVESIRPRSGDVRNIAGSSEVVLVRGEVLPILRLYSVFGALPEVTDPTRGLLVIVENDACKVALLVDELIGQSQVVIKSLETNYGKVYGVAGATILGDGRVALILDIPGLIGNRGGAARLAA